MDSSDSIRHSQSVDHFTDLSMSESGETSERLPEAELPKPTTVLSQLKVIAAKRESQAGRLKAGRVTNTIGVTAATAIGTVGGVLLAVGLVSNPVGWAILGVAAVGLLVMGIGAAIAASAGGSVGKDMVLPALKGVGYGVAVLTVVGIAEVVHQSDTKGDKSDVGSGFASGMMLASSGGVGLGLSFPRLATGGVDRESPVDATAVAQTRTEDDVLDELSPDELEAYKAVAEDLGKEKFKAAEIKLQSLLDNHQDADAARMLLVRDLGLVCLAQNKVGTAIEHQLALVEQLLAKDDPDQAQTILRSITTEYRHVRSRKQRKALLPQIQQAQKNMALAQVEKGNYAEAHEVLTDFKPLLEIGNKSLQRDLGTSAFELHAEVAERLLEKGEYAKAFDCIQALRQDWPGPSPLHLVSEETEGEAAGRIIKIEQQILQGMTADPKKRLTVMDSRKLILDYRYSLERLPADQLSQAIEAYTEVTGQYIVSLMGEFASRAAEGSRLSREYPQVLDDLLTVCTRRMGSVEVLPQIGRQIDGGMDALLKGVDALVDEQQFDEAMRLGGIAKAMLRFLPGAKIVLEDMPQAYGNGDMEEVHRLRGLTEESSYEIRSEQLQNAVRKCINTQVLQAQMLASQNNPQEAAQILESMAVDGELPQADAGLDSLKGVNYATWGEAYADVTDKLCDQGADIELIMNALTTIHKVCRGMIPERRKQLYLDTCNHLLGRVEQAANPAEKLTAYRAARQALLWVPGPRDGELVRRVNTMRNQLLRETGAEGEWAEVHAQLSGMQDIGLGGPDRYREVRRS